MAQRVQVLLVCDLHHDDETPGTQTVSFALDGAGYEIDVCDEHATELRNSFARYVGLARRAVGRAAPTGRRRATRRPGGGNGPDPAAVRSWAREHGVKVSERGRISADVLEQYAASAT